MPIGKQPSTKSAKEKYLSQFPSFFHPYINDIVDVESDGNYGYRSVSDVSSSLVVTHLGDQDMEKWMSIPDMGYSIASRYSVVFVSLSMAMNTTFFPLLIAPPSYTSRHAIIAVGFVNRNHWVQIKLRPDCPLPPVTAHWRKNCSNDAKS
ncbi:uncharacterized protein LOC131605661 [Vicia villosa]|uniref:uncharacterized protein LOC131605661 n=1 Tax=Vicia villosa TaxID=3911 RepID=UPI00273C7802|nr:uncharacterized protein LOC131605661 [Vicia villosa]